MGKKAKSQVRNERELKYLYFLLKEIMKKDIPLTTDEILNFILEKAINLTKADVGDISILDKQQNELVVYASHGKPIREIFRHSIEEGITGWVAIKKTPSLVGDTQADKRYIVCVQDPEIRSELAVPLLYSGELLGVLNVESKEKKHFTEENLNNLTELSEQLGFFIKFHQEWEALYQRTKHIIFPHNVNELLNIIINGLINLLSVDAITFYPYDQIAQKVPTPPLMAGVFYNKKALWGEFSKENVVGKSLHDKQPHFADDARNDPLMFNKDITPNFIKRENIKSSAVIPLNYEQEIFGILFLNFRYSHSFSQSEMEILPDLAKYISSIAVKLRKIEHKELMTLSSINQAIIGLEDIDKVMELILKEALRMVDEEKTGWAWLYLTDENKGEFKARAFSPLISPEHKERILKEKDNIIGSTANGVIKNIYDLQRLPKEKYVQFIPQARSRIAVPIKSLRENESLGVIVIDSPKTYAFSAYAERLLSVLADQVALAVQSNKLIEKARKQEEVLKRVVKVGAYFERDSGFILKEIAGALNLIIDVDIPLIFIYDERFNAFSDVHYGDVSDEWGKNCRPRINGLGEQAIKSGKAEVTHLGEKPGIHEFPENRGVKTTVAIPLKTEYNTVGVMYLHFLGEKWKPQNSKEVLNWLAMEHVPRVVQIIQGLSDGLSETDLREEFWEKTRGDKYYELFKDIDEKTEADILLIYLHNEKKVGNERFGGCVFSRINTAWGLKSWPRKEGTGQRALNENKIINFPLNNIHPFPEKKGVKTSVTVPLILTKRKLGVIYLHFLTKRKFSEEDLGQIEVFAHYAAITLDGLRRARELDHLETISKIVEDITSAQGLVKVGENIAKGIDKILEGGIPNIYLYDQEKTAFSFLACSGESDELFLGKFMPRKNGIGAKVISEAQKLISQGKDIETVRKESVFISSVELSPSAMDKNIKTTACFPLFFGKEILGLLYLHFKEKRDFSPEELLKIHLLVDQTAIAIKNAEQKRSSNIEAVTNRLSEKIFHQEFMQYMVHLVKKIFKARWCSCFSYNKHADTVILTASTNSRFKALIKDSKPVQYKLGQGVSGWIAKHQRVLRLIQWGDERVLKTYDSQMTWDEEYNKGENAEEMNAKSFSFMAAPLVIDKQLLGIIRVVKNGKKSFDIEDEKLLLELIPVLSLNFKNALQASILQKWLSIAAHEFCGSLAGLQFLINELNAGNLNIERQKFYLELLQGITVHFSRVVNNFSYLGRITIQSLKRYEEKKVDIEGIIKRFGILYIQHENAENKKNLRLVINNKDKLRSVNIIEEGLASIISNLMSNAVKYSMPNKEIIVNIKMENRHWACEVINKGDPIPKKIMPHLFSPPPLFIEERDGKKGLGLYIVHEWIKELGGNLKVDSTHKETKFAFTLPIKQFTRRGSNDPSNRR